MIEIEESGIIFGPFTEDSVYAIEKSHNIPSNVKLVEFAWVPPRGNYIVLVEAKSSFSKPSNHKDFDENLQEICTKLIGSLTVLIATKLGRHPAVEAELPIKLENVTWDNLTIEMRLVIPSFEDDWLPPISDALRKRLKYFLASFGLSEKNFQVLNKRLALQQGLVKPDGR